MQSLAETAQSRQTDDISEILKILESVGDAFQNEPVRSYLVRVIVNAYDLHKARVAQTETRHSKIQQWALRSKAVSTGIEPQRFDAALRAVQDEIAILSSGMRQ